MFRHCEPPASIRWNRSDTSSLVARSERLKGDAPCFLKSLALMDCLGDQGRTDREDDRMKGNRVERELSAIEAQKQ